MHQNSIHLFAIFKPPNCSISRGENEGRVTVASTASEYPLADFLNAEYRHVGYLLSSVLKSVRFGGFAPLYRRPQAKNNGISHPFSYSFACPRQGIKKRHRFVLPMALPRQMAGLYSVAHYLLLVVLHPQPIFKRFSGNADHVSNPDRLKLAGVCELVGRGFSNAENSGYVLHSVGPVFRRLFSVRCTDRLIPETNLRHTIIRIRQKKLWYL